MRHPFTRFFFFFVLLVRASRAETDLQAGERLYEQARAEESRLEFGKAVLDYDTSLAVAPSGRWALAARARSDDLHAHSEGDFRPLTALERVRRGPQTNEALDGLLRDADKFPNGPVRAEARMLAAEGFLSALGRKEDGARALGLVLDDPSADPTIKRFAARRLADMALAEGRTADARDAAARADDPSLEKRVARSVRRGFARKLSKSAIACALVLAAAAIVRRRKDVARIRRALSAHFKTVAAFSVVVALGGVIASSYERGNALPFVVLGIAIGILACVALAWSSIGSTASWARVGRAIVCGAAIAGAGFLVLDRIDARYLEAFGL